MLADVRKALADTIREAMPEARVFAFPPREDDIPPEKSGVIAYVQPDPNEYVAPWLTGSVTGRAVIKYQVVLAVVDTDNPDRDMDRLDDLIDPQSDAANVFRAILDNPTLGITDFQVSAAPLLEAVAAPTRERQLDTPNVFSYELVLPVQVIVQRS